MVRQNIENIFGFILFKIGDIGPEQISYENIPKKIKKNFEDKLSFELGIYLSLVISQGKGLNNEGLFGPIPWYQLPDHELYIFSFLVNDPLITDLRKKNNVLLFLTIIFPRRGEALINSRYEIQKSMEQLYIKPKEKRLLLNDDNIFFIIDSSKDIFIRAFDSGKKLLQEKTLDEVINFKSIEQFALYSKDNYSLKSCFIGKEVELPQKDFFIDQSREDYQISVHKYVNGSSSLTLEFKERNIVIYIKLNHSLKLEKLIRLLSKIDSSLEILAYYI